MIVIDSSALIAMIAQERDALAYFDAIAGSGGAALSVVNYVETCMVASSRLHDGIGKLNVLLETLEIGLEPVDVPLARQAFDAFLCYGKGRHPAGLNICDCFAYALAKNYDVPLLFKGDDFAKTDIISAL